ncbi:peptidase S10 serine carboxypeptidase [Ramaria rubella]|nr:peptidase S10 serine carboxypeptidase [Ramaria rubella]
MPQYQRCIWLIFSILVYVGSCFQIPLGTGTPASGSLVVAPLNLSAVSQHFTVLSHPRFPAYQVRIKRSNFCDPTVKVWTGYIDVDFGAKHMFFYFFESRQNPDTDDVVMWINGGPGCSSSMGLLMELGPCNIDMTKSSTNGTIWNPYSWNTNANIFFLDQPVGVGFSYAEYGETIETTEDAARNIYAFVSIFFDTFTQFQGRRLHLAGESYGGKYLPVFASRIYQEDQKTSGVPINLSSVIIGNGITDISTLYPGRYDVACGRASLETPLLSISTCVRMKQANNNRCQRLLRDKCIDLFDDMDCQAAVNFCDAEISAPLQVTGRNVYDISKECVGTLCYEESDTIVSFLNQRPIRDLLGVTLDSGNFTSCSDTVGRNFASHLDKWRVPAQLYVAELLERGIRVLLYAGTYDWQCNWKANWLWSDSLEWSGGDKFRSQLMRDWALPGKETIAGQTRSANNLTFASVYAAGHMVSLLRTNLNVSSADLQFIKVPHDKPAEALHMLQRWLAEEDLS